MIRKLLTTILCVLLALALPLSALAATEYTVSVVPGDDLASIAPVKDLAEALSLRLLAGEQSGMLTVAISGTDAMSLAVRGTADGIYMQSAALADQPLYFSRADVENFVVGMMPAEDKENAMAVRQAIEQAFTAFAVVSAGTQDKATQTLTEAFEKVQSRFANDPAMADYITGIISSVKTTDGEFTDAAHDPATQMSELSVTSKDLVKLADSEMIKKLMASSDSDLTPEEAVEQFRKAVEGLDYNMPITIYTADEGKTLVAMSMPMTMKGMAEVTKTEDGVTKTEKEAVDIVMDMHYNRLTEGAQIKHTAVMTLADKGEKEFEGLMTVINDGNGSYTLDASLGKADDDDKDEAFLMQGALNKEESGSSGWLAALGDQIQFTMEFNAAETAAGMQKSIAIYAPRSEAAAIIAPAASDRPMVTLNLLTKEVDEEALAAVNDATPENSMQLLQLPADQQETELGAITAKLMQTGFSALSLLPQSVMELFMDTDTQAK